MSSRLKYSRKRVGDYEGFLKQYVDFQSFRCACILTDVRLTSSETRMGPAPEGNVLPLPERREEVELRIQGRAHQVLTAPLDLTLQYRMGEDEEVSPAVENIERIIDEGRLVILTAQTYAVYPDGLICYEPEMTVLPDRYETVFGQL